jgi:hypothetical protein
VHDHRVHLVPILQRVIGHAQLVPRVRIHRLQRGGLAECVCRPIVLPQGGVRKPQPIPCAIELWMQAGRFAESPDRLFKLAALVSTVRK